MSRTSRFWLLELEESAHAEPERRAEVWRKLHEIADVARTTDMAVVSFATLDEIMAPSDPEIVRLWRMQRREAARAAQLPAGA